jgi:hypothetical protein
MRTGELRRIYLPRTWVHKAKKGVPNLTQMEDLHEADLAIEDLYTDPFLVGYGRLLRSITHDRRSLPVSSLHVLSSFTSDL